MADDKRWRRKGRKCDRNAKRTIGGKAFIGHIQICMGNGDSGRLKSDRQRGNDAMTRYVHDVNGVAIPVAHIKGTFIIARSKRGYIGPGKLRKTRSTRLRQFDVSCGCYASISGNRRMEERSGCGIANEGLSG